MNLKRLKQSTRIVLLTAAILCSGNLLAQDLISGRVVDSDGEAVIGATVMVDNTSNVTISGPDGAFSLRAASGSPITVTFVGNETTQAILSPGVLVTMNPDANLIENVVVVGYGTQRKETLTGAIAVVNNRVFEEKGSLSSPLQALQGQVPGVFITRSSSAPGDESWDMSLRGAVSRSSTPPLIVIDGVASSGGAGDLRLINPADIEAMSFLKDGAAAIYGSRAAGGVVLITTKKGSEGRTRVEYNGSVSIKTPGLMPEMMTYDQFADASIMALENDGLQNDVWYPYYQGMKAYKGSYIDLTQTSNPFNIFGDVSDIVFDDKVDWLGSLFRNAVSTSHDLNVSGGTEKVSYRVSVGYLYDGSPLQYGKNNNNRYNLRSTTTYQIAKWLSLESIIAYNRQEQVRPHNLAGLTNNLPQPGLPLFSMDGKAFAWGTGEANMSPASKSEFGGENKLSVSAINISETFKARITGWLDANVNLGYNTSTARRNDVANSILWYNYDGTRLWNVLPTQENTSYKQTASQADFYSLTGYLNGHHTFGKKHNLNAMLGYQYEYESWLNLAANATDIQEGVDNINGSGTITIPRGGSKGDNRKGHTAISSLFGRVNYDFDQKYLLEFNMRYDGSSRFLPENRWSFFWGMSAGWRISQENFLKEARWLDELKLRFSYGEVGNQGSISYYDGLLLYNPTGPSGALVGDGLLPSIGTDGQLISFTHTWERIKNYNIGLDFGFLGNRLTGSVEAFMKRNDNMFVSHQYPAVIGDGAPEVNEGKFRSHGFEGQIMWRDKVGDWTYSVGGAFTFARNELIDLGGSALVQNGYRSDREGYPLNSLFGLRYAGKIQTEEQREAYETKFIAGNTIGAPLGVLRLGDNMYADEDGDGKLTIDDYVYLGTDTPEIQFSFSASVGWKGIDVSAIFQGAANRTVYRGDGGNGLGVHSMLAPTRTRFNNSTNASIGKTWSPENPNAFYPSYTFNSAINSYNYQPSSWSASDGTYLRLKNITVSYTMPRALFERQNVISGVRFYFTGTDLWEVSNIHEGWDPEARRNPSNTERYPFLRTYTFGANITF